MQVFNNLNQLPSNARNAVVAIGNFDGVHRGHQALLNEARRVAKEKKAPLAVLTFEPHPRKLFRPDEPPGRLSPPDVKLWRLGAESIDLVYIATFDWNFASLSAEDFIRKVLIEGLGAAHVVIGYDFRFGQFRKGEAAHIEAAGLSVSVVKAVADETGQPLSSSRIRQILRLGHIDEANALLGWNWEMRGVVVKGDQRGRELGYPTANFNLGETVHPAYGVYAARVNIDGESEWHNAAINIGIRPMFEIPEAQVESFIFDFSREIYDKTLRVQPVKRLRSEAKFNALEDLIKQMDEDCRQARTILKA